MIIAGIIIGTFIIIVNFYWLCDLISDIKESRRKNKPSDLAEMYKIEMMVGKENSIDTDNR